MLGMHYATQPDKQCLMQWCVHAVWSIFSYLCQHLVLLMSS